MKTLELIWFMFLKTIINNTFLKKLGDFENCSYFFNLVFCLCFLFFSKFKNKNYMRTEHIFNIFFVK